MKIVVRMSLLVVLLFSFAGFATAQKFGYVNSAAILNEMPEMKQLRSSIEAFQNILKKDGEAKLTTYRQEEQAALQKKQRGEMTPKEEEEVMKKLQKMQEEIYAYSQKMEDDLAKKQQDEMQPILDKVNGAIQAVAKEGGYQYIFDAQSGVILYADESTDVTSQVKAKLGMQ